VVLLDSKCLFLHFPCYVRGHDQCSGKKNVQSTETNCDNGKQLLSACFSKGESLVGNGKVVAVTQRSIAEHKFHDDLELHLQNGGTIT